MGNRVFALPIPCLRGQVSSNIGSLRNFFTGPRSCFNMAVEICNGDFSGSFFHKQARECPDIGRNKFDLRRMPETGTLWIAACGGGGAFFRYCGRARRKIKTYVEINDGTIRVARWHFAFKFSKIGQLVVPCAKQGFILLLYKVG